MDDNVLSNLELLLIQELIDELEAIIKEKENANGNLEGN